MTEQKIEPTKLPIVEAAKMLRKELQEKFPGQPFSVRVDRFSMGESIRVAWTDGVAVTKVDPILKKYEEIDYDKYTGEILAGGNRYVQAHRRISDEVRKKEEDARAKLYGEEFNQHDYQHYRHHGTVWRKICETDYPVLK